MAANFPGPYELRFVYTNPPLVHTQRLNIDLTTDPAPGTTFDLLEAVPRVGTGYNLELGVDNWIIVLRNLLHTTVTINYVELWKYEPESFDATFISAYDVGLAGLAAASPVPAGQMIWTFRTLEGGVLRINVMEAARAPGSPVSYPALAATEKALVDFILADDNCFLGRDTSYPFAFMRLNPGQSEALFKRRYRTT